MATLTSIKLIDEMLAAFRATKSLTMAQGKSDSAAITFQKATIEDENSMQYEYFRNVVALDDVKFTEIVTFGYNDSLEVIETDADEESPFFMSSVMAAQIHDQVRHLIDNERVVRGSVYAYRVSDKFVNAQFHYYL